DFAYSGGVDLKGDVSVTYKDILSQSKITAFILGGDAGSASQTIDSYDALISFIKSGGNYSRQSPGAPIAYKLSYLKDNSPARMSFTTNYTLRDCARVSQQVVVTLNSIYCKSADDGIGDSTLEVYGQITAQGSGPVQSLFAKDSGQTVSISQGQTFGSPMIKQVVISVMPKVGQTITLHAHLFDKDTLSGDDDLGDEISVNPFDTGWRKDVTIQLAIDKNNLQVNLSLAPI
ncbi:MAG TPA: thiol-activated cytolysin family protein, partial [Kofleriaceae bacterium]